jgi:hypothetical protein
MISKLLIIGFLHIVCALAQLNTAQVGYVTTLTGQPYVYCVEDDGTLDISLRDRNLFNLQEKDPAFLASPWQRASGII